MINKFGVRFNNHDEIIREFKESPLKYELVKINFQRRLEKSVSKKSGFIITNENSDYK
jgi:hypothetical protein